MKTKRTLIFFALALTLVIGMVWCSDKYITANANGKTFDKIDSLPQIKVGLLLGTSKMLKSGNENLYFNYRMAAATQLLKSGKIKYLIISGDNGNKAYDEPSDMKHELIKNGIDSTKLYLDYAGFRTFDSVVRAKEIFGQNEILIISQKFHNERAIYIADQLNIKAFGYNAQDVMKYYGIKTAIREKFARVKVILDFVFGVEPKFLGEKVRIG